MGGSPSIVTEFYLPVSNSFQHCLKRQGTKSAESATVHSAGLAIQRSWCLLKRFSWTKFSAGLCGGIFETSPTLLPASGSWAWFSNARRSMDIHHQISSNARPSPYFRHVFHHLPPSSSDEEESSELELFMLVLPSGWAPKYLQILCSPEHERAWTTPAAELLDRRLAHFSLFACSIPLLAFFEVHAEHNSPCLTAPPCPAVRPNQILLWGQKALTLKRKVRTCSCFSKWGKRGRCQPCNKGGTATKWPVFLHGLSSLSSSSVCIYIYTYVLQYIQIWDMPSASSLTSTQARGMAHWLSDIFINWGKVEACKATTVFLRACENQDMTRWL